ncbi:uncharacterized protein LOC122091581 [Macadamia integrifolia]|uniref:uncharacterized protein LOC122091581 n=1 Tax=Macadamia integrifolia TaxID=60698 RepID=UPI001C4EF976|nr:uncharacterized protein LOC122091581 [Macadamia integrifolia]
MSCGSNLVVKHRFRFASWNIGSLTGKIMELIDVMRKRRINVAGRGGVSIVVDKDLKDDIVEVKRLRDRILAIKLVLGDEVINIVCAYAPQAGLDDRVKVQFWEDMDELIQGLSQRKKIIFGGDLNGHVGKGRRGFEEVHRGHELGERNAKGTSMLDFAIAYDLCIVNTFFEKRYEHVVTYKSGLHVTWRPFHTLTFPDLGEVTQARYLLEN